MSNQAPKAIEHYAIFSTIVKDIIGICLDPNDSHEEQQRYIRISAEEYDGWLDWTEAQEVAILSRPRLEIGETVRSVEACDQPKKDVCANCGRAIENFQDDWVHAAADGYPRMYGCSADSFDVAEPVSQSHPSLQESGDADFDAFPLHYDGMNYFFLDMPDRGDTVFAEIRGFGPGLKMDANAAHLVKVWNESLRSKSPEPPAVHSDPVGYCWPRDKDVLWILRFDDPERGEMHFHSEREAREAFKQESVGWNCYLLAPVPITEPPAGPAFESMKRYDLERISAGYAGTDHEMQEWPTGEWVKWEDVKALTSSPIDLNATREKGWKDDFPRWVEFVERFEDMSREGKVRIQRQQDGDVILTVVGRDAIGVQSFSSVEFCAPMSGGGKSEKTWIALMRLAEAMEDDNKDKPQDRPAFVQGIGGKP